jgi:chemotaxis signal transduction protein
VKTSRPSRKTSGTKSAPQHDVILFSVNQTTFAIAAGAVDEIRNLDGLTPFQPSFTARLTKVKHTLVRENKDPDQTYFVVDSAVHLKLKSSTPGRLMVLRGVKAAVLVDAIDRMTQIAAVHPLPRAFQGDERQWYRGLALVEGRVVPVVNEHSFLSRSEVTVLHAQKQARAQGVGA